MGAGTVPDKILNPEHAVLLVRGVKSSSHQANKEDSKKVVPQALRGRSLEEENLLDLVLYLYYMYNLGQVTVSLG